MKNILITGGAGFIGSHISMKLVKSGYNITVLDNLSEQIHGRNSLLYEKIKNHVNFIKGDVCNKEDWLRALNKQDAIIHLAAETGTGQSMYEIANYNKVNIIGTANMLDILANTQHSIKKIITSSSRAIYGEGKYIDAQNNFIYPKERDINLIKKGIFEPICNISKKPLKAVATDENSKIQPISSYGLTKYYQEQILFLMGRSLNIPVVALRYQNVFGPEQSLINPYTGILSIFSTRILNNNDIEIYEDGLMTRDFVYIDDVVEATIEVMKNKNANNNFFNVGSGCPVTVLEVANSLKSLYNSKINIQISKRFRAGDIRHNFANISKIRDVTGFVPKFDFNTGLSKFVEWVKKQKIHNDKYEESVEELSKKGLIK
tara:strand:+ start:218 stop:1342 length:1125 start_codon:yes stop_codon:yes gene_type:complete